MPFKSYSRKDAAKIGAHRIGLPEEAVIKGPDGKWGFHLPRGAAALPKLGNDSSKSGDGPGSAAVVEAIKQQTLAIDHSIVSTSVALADKLGGLLVDIRDLLAAQNTNMAAAKSASELRRLEDEREKNNKLKVKPTTGFLPSISKSAGGLLDVLKMLSTPFILGAFTELEKFFDLIGRSKEKLSKLGGRFQGFLDTVANLPMFKDNILGKGIRNLIPILGGVGLFALWKPSLAVKGFKGLFNLISWISKNPSLTGAAEGAAGKLGILGKVGRVAGKFALPVTIATALFETGKGALDGWKKEGAFGAFQGAINGLVHGLIGGIVDTISQGIGWILDQFGVESERFKAFSFAKFLDDLGANLATFMFDTFGDIKSSIDDALKSFKDIWNSDESLTAKILDSITYPFTLLVNKFKKEFGGLSTVDIIKKLMAMATGNGAVEKALESASRPAPKPAQPVQQWPTVQAVIQPQQSITGLITGTSSARLEAEARKAGLTDAQIAYTYETDSMIGAPKGATLAQLKQESGFNNRARSPTGAVGISQFTNVAIDDVLFGRAAKTDEERAKRRAAKEALNGNTDMGLEYQRKLLKNIQTRSGNNWQQVMRAYNGDVSLEKNGMQARDNYIQRIRGYLSADGMAATQKSNTGAALQNTTEQVNDAKKAATAAATFAPVNASRTNIVNNNQSNQLSNLSASTPVEFAPLVV